MTYDELMERQTLNIQHYQALATQCPRGAGSVPMVHWLGEKGWRGLSFLAIFKDAPSRPPRQILLAQETYRVSVFTENMTFIESFDLRDDDARCRLGRYDIPKIPPLSPTAVQAISQHIIQARLPVVDVDAWIVANMGYTPERLAALGKATRRDRRRQARQQMTAGS